MRIGDLVRLKTEWGDELPGPGIIIGFTRGDPVVFWNEEFSAEIEYSHQLEVISD